ncbi:HNH endonuclease signature motif containing protein [Nakamurella sp. PAMC28650]|uniref:HNH endonuclease signature motif containing protein n=1 Tax=Nakamurella sp. PAMC28650 TaxID=2762325 RepID=UPI00164E4E63|nr:HNH endonuclease signature motif containing protein [Nakamurella sp. PAMC28650]QNK82399.1 HNH endonuclease [Nakamurella sp. PAMC28650]
MVVGPVFSLTGDAGSISSSSVRWSQFAASAASAADDIRRIDSGDFIGDEADTYRDKLNQDLPPHLDTTSDAWSAVAAALQNYAATLESLQQRLSSLSAQASDQQSQVDSANNAVAHAKTADAQHTTAVQAQTKALTPGQTLPPDTYRPQAADASSELSGANNALQATTDAANRVHQEHDAAVQTCVNAIDRAAGLRFEEPPGFWGRLGNSVSGWISEHADVLKTISSVLKTISGIAGLLALIPCLTPIMGPIALIAGGAALLIDVTVKVTTGQGSWTDIVMDTVGLIPGGRLAGDAVKGAEAATGAVKAVSTVAHDAKAVENVASEARKADTIATEATGMKNAASRAETGGKDVTGNAGDAKYADPGPDPLPTITLKYKNSWSPAQRAAADTKARQLHDLALQGKLEKTDPERLSGLRSRFKKAFGDGAVTKDQDVDHIHELQLGGRDELGNVQALDRSVNRSVGSQIRHQIKDHVEGTRYGGVSIVPRR